MSAQPERVCPDCHRLHEAKFGVGGYEHDPEPGSLSICYYCSAFLVFTEDMGFRLLTDEEFERLPREAKGMLLGIRDRLTQKGLARPM